MFAMRPDAILNERESMLDRTIQTLRTEGYVVRSAHDFAGLPDTEEVLIHVLNIHVRPDIQADGSDNAEPLNAFVEVSTALTHDDCGRRWRALAAWCAEHGARMQIFVHPEDERLARRVAEQWHLESDDIIRPLARH